MQRAYMANLNAAIQRLRRVRTNLDAPPPRNFDRYREIYWVILSETADLAGDAVFDELNAWMLETTRTAKALPEPDAVRVKARELCSARGISIPPGSPLLD